MLLWGEVVTTKGESDEVDKEASLGLCISSLDFIQSLQQSSAGGGGGGADPISQMCKLWLPKSRVLCPRPPGRKPAEVRFKARATSYRYTALLLLFWPGWALEGRQSVSPRAHPPQQIRKWAVVQFTGLPLCSGLPALSYELRLRVPSRERGQLSEPREMTTWVLLAWGADTPARLAVTPTCPSRSLPAAASLPCWGARETSQHLITERMQAVQGSQTTALPVSSPTAPSSEHMTGRGPGSVSGFLHGVP